MRRRVRRLLSRSLDVRPGEGRAIALLFSLSTFIGVFVAFFFSVANSAFLGEIEDLPKILPYAYILSGLVGYLAVRAFGVLETKVGLRRAMSLNLVALLAMTLLFLLGRSASDSPWVSFLMFIAIVPALTLLDLEFWGLAGRVFDLQQGKRLFGLISSGEVISAAFGFFLVPALISLGLGSRTLLILATLGLGAALLLLPILFRQFPERLGDRAEVGTAAEERPKKSLGELVGDRTFLLLSTVTLLFVVNLFLVDFTFLVGTREHFLGQGELGQLWRETVGGAEALTGFLGFFFGLVKFCEFLAKTMLSGRLSANFGLASTLLLTPALVLLWVVIALMSGELWGTGGGLFFAAIAMAKLSEFVGRKAFFDPSFRILFQPLPSEDRFSIQTLVDGAVRQIGLGVAGGLLALVALAGGADFRLVGLLLIAVLTLWIAATVLAFRDYRSGLREVLSQQTRRGLVRSPEEILQERLKGAPAAKVRPALDVLARVDFGVFVRLLGQLLDTSNPEVLRSVLERVGWARVVTFGPRIEEIADKAEDPGVVSAASTARQRLREVAELGRNPELTAEYARAGEPVLRRMAALAIIHDPRPETRDLLPGLLWDDDRATRRIALLAAGISKRSEYWPRLIAQISSGVYSKSAMSALVSIGEDVLPALDFSFRRREASTQTLLRILEIYRRIGGSRAEALLFDKIDHPNQEVQEQALTCLGQCGYQARGAEVGLIHEKLESVVDRLTWSMAAGVDLAAHRFEGELTQALEWRLKKDQGALFLLLALVCDPEVVRLMRTSFQSTERESRAYALEIAAEVVPLELREALFPIFEQLPPAQTLERLDLLFPQRRLSLAERLRDIARQGAARVDRWTRACALEALGRACEGEPPGELRANFFLPDPMVREIAAREITRLDPALGERLLGHLPTEEREALERALELQAAGWLSSFEKVRRVSRTDVFSGVPLSLLARFASGVREIHLGRDEVLFAEGASAQSMYIIVVGTLRIQRGEKTLDHLGELDVLGEIGVLGTGARTAAAIAEEPTRVLEVERGWLQDLLADHLEFLPVFLDVIDQRLARH